MADLKGSTGSEVAAARAETESIRERLAARRQKRSDLIAAATKNALPLNNPNPSTVSTLFKRGVLSNLPTLTISSTVAVDKKPLEGRSQFDSHILNLVSDKSPNLP